MSHSSLLLALCFNKQEFKEQEQKQCNNRVGFSSNSV